MSSKLDLSYSVNVTNFSPVLYVNDGNLEFSVLYEGNIDYDDNDTKSLLYQIKNHWSKITWLSDIKGPYMLWTGCCGAIKPLDSLDLNPQIIEKFKTQGLTFILYEPLCTYRKDHFNNFVDHLNYDQFESTNENLQELMSYELDSISDFAERMGLESPVTVYTCNYKVKKYFQEKYPRLDLFCKDIFLSVDCYTPDNRYDNIEGKSPHKKFICLNRRYTSVRNLSMLYLASTKSFFSGNYSWNVLTDMSYLNDKLWFDFNSWTEKQPYYYDKLNQSQNVLNNVLPLTIDNLDPVAYFIGDPQRQDPDPALNRFPRISYMDAFVSVVNETRFAEPTGNFSEKTINPMKAHRPFVIFAPPYTLEYLHHLGFKTFGDFWDESYDREENHEKRLTKIFDVIDKLDQLTFHDQRYLLDKMKPILEHNSYLLPKLSKEFPTIPY